jgi:lantibiotic transport system permease protein
MYLSAFQSEWLKKKRSAASWLTVAGALLVPAIIIVARFVDGDGLAETNRSARLWETLYNRSWQFMGFFLLPMGVVLATSLIVQLEYRSQGWKQLAAAPVSYPAVYVAKLGVILALLLEFFVLFNLGIWLEGVLPALSRGVSYPAERFPFVAVLWGNGRFLLDCLPIVALQYVLSLQFRNFMIPLGVGLGLYVAAMVAAHWRYGYAVPYTYPVLEYIGKRSPSPGADFHVWSIGYTVLFLVVGYILYITKKERA